MKNRVIHQICGELWGKVAVIIGELWGKPAKAKLSPNGTSFPQSYPQGFPRALQAVIPQSTGSTTITVLINKIYW